MSTFTTNYNWTKPTVSGDNAAWGGYLNTDLDGIDTTVFAISGVANAALPKAGGTMTGALVAAVGAVGAPSITFAGDLTTGIYRVGANSLALVSGGTAVLTTAAGAVTANGTMTVTGAFTATALATFNNKAQFIAGTTALPSFNAPHGVAPTAPTNGDFWTTTVGVFCRVNGSTLTLATTAGSVLLAVNNLSDVASVATARTNLGITATGADTTYAARASNLSDLNSAATARTNLGLTTAATTALGTSGATIPLLNTANTWSASQYINGAQLTIGATTNVSGKPLHVQGAASSEIQLHASNGLTDFRAWNLLVDGTSGQKLNFTLRLMTDNGQTTQLTGFTISGANGVMTVPQAIALTNGGNIAATAGTSAKEIGYAGIPQFTKAANYTLTAADLRQECFVTSTCTITIPSNASVAADKGEFYVISADAGVTVTLAINTDTLRYPIGNSTTSRTLTGPAFAAVSKKKTTEWWVVGGMNIT